MSKINALIKEMCPNGVKFYKLSDIGEQFNGLSGKSKKDFENGNYKYITYTNIYNNPSTNLEIEDYVQVDKNEKQNEIRFKDILIAGSSENLEDSGMISVVTKEPEDKIYLNSFCFGLRLKTDFYEKFNANFLKHLFRDNNFRNEIVTCSFGVTRYNLSKEKFLKIKIPCPPLEVQEEIVRILDKFCQLEAELEAELEARKNQYEFWRSKLLENSKNKVKLGEIATIVRGGSPRPIQNFITTDDNGIPWIKIGDTNPNDKYVVATKEKITVDGSKKSRFVKAGDFILSNSMSFGRPYILKIEGCIHDGWLSISNFEDTYIPDFLYHLLSSKPIQDTMAMKASFGTVKNLNADIVKSIELPLYTKVEQEKIVKILDKFEELTNDISVGIPAEIELRRQQYEYYRNKLLSFEELSIN